MLAGCHPFPDEDRRRYRQLDHWRGQSLGDCLRAWTRRSGEQTALVHGGSRMSYARLDQQADRLAAGFQALGLGARDRVVVQLPNIPQFVTTCFALFRLGAIPVLALPAHRRSEIVAIAREAQARAYVIPAEHHGFDHRRLATEVRAEVPEIEHVLVAEGDPGSFRALASIERTPTLLPPVDADEVALFLLSGGSTGIPKLIPRTHNDYAFNIRACAMASDLGSQDVQLVVLPMAHNGALGCPGVFGSLATGGVAVLAASGSPDEAFPLIAREGVTITTLVPPLALLWTESAPWAAEDLSSLRLLQVGGAKLGIELARRVRPTLGCQLQQWYGMAEGILCHTRLDDPPEVILSTQGRPLCPADELRVVDGEDRDLPPGEVGELLVRGPTTFRGYFNAPTYNQRIFTRDGYFRTGDLVRRTARGDLVVEGRTKDLINRGGEKISAEEIENLLLGHPDVLNAALVAMPDAVLGERSCLFLIARGQPLSTAVVGDYLTARGVAAHKLPDRVEMVTAFPETSVGKTSKAALRAMIARKLTQEAS
jgi:2,3-dihydroxybenzoate-AMP ligase